MLPLTKKQKQILDFISDFIANNDYAPSYREIGEYFNFSSVATVAEYVDILKQKGYLNKQLNCARSLQLTPSFEPERFEAPLLGLIAAGQPIEAIRTHETIDIPKDMIGKQTFALQVRGDSMKEDGILDGDYVIIEQCRTPRNGEIVVALVDQANVTLKRFYKEGDHIRLQPANSAYAPIISRKVIVQGRVKGVLRKFI